MFGKVNGKFFIVLIFIPSSQHLKSRFGKGYNVEVKLNATANFEELHHFMLKTFENAQLTENHGLNYHFEISQQNLSLSRVFKELESQQSILGIEDYSVSQTTLEQIFLKMSQEQPENASVTIHIAE